MPTGSLDRALILVQPGLSVSDSDYTYYFAPRMPTYAVGQQMPHMTAPGGTTRYTYAAADYVDVGTGLNPALASHAMARMDAVSGLFFSSQANFNADIAIFGINRSVYQGSDPVYAPERIS